MKRINLAILSVVLLLLASACEKDQRFVQYPDLEKGAFARLLTKQGAFFLTDIANSSISISVEFYDENNGQNVTSYAWTVSYLDKANGGANNAGPLAYKEFTTSDFSPSPDGLPGLSFTITFQEIMDLFGFGPEDINGGDAFRFDATLTRNDGKKFTRINTGPNVISSAPFSGFFTFDADILCTSDLAGTYTVVTTYYQHDFIADGFTENTLTGVEVRKVSDGVYEVDDFSGGLYAVDAPYGVAYGTDGLVVQFTDACGKINFAGQSDPWQELLQDPMEGRESKVDQEKGVITISVLGSVYGENWTSVYTPE